jgi:hypothetical protein
MIPAPPRSRGAITVLGAGLALGVLADLLLRTTPWGANLAVWTAALLGTGAWLARRLRVPVAAETPWLALIALLLAADCARRDAPDLLALTLLALFGVLGIAAWSARGIAPRREGVAAWLRGWTTAALASVVGMLPLTLQDVRWTDPDATGPLRHAPAIGMGVLLATPLLLVFGSLFASADAVFSATVDAVLRPEVVVPHVLCSLAGTAISAGYLRHALLGRSAATAVDAAGRTGPGPVFVPVVTALVLVNALFVVFVAVQLRYLFGGTSLVQATIGLTYAEYARRGFFELVSASALVLPLLVAAEWAVRGEAAARRADLRRLATVLLLLVMVIVASALVRMRLYVAAFGLTTPRVYATAGEVFLLGVFAWFAWTSLRGHHERFAWGAFLIGLAVLGGLHAMNPDAFVVRWNLARPGSERPFDAQYAAELGADAAPALVDALPGLAPTDRCVIVTRLRSWERAGGDWRSWNLARARARRLAQEHAAAFDALCPDPDGSLPGG